jgi:c-di-GMP-binding flagellar brake protein YcgR
MEAEPQKNMRNCQELIIGGISMLREVLTLGDKIDIKLLDRNGKSVRDAKTLVSKLMDFLDTDVISITTPFANGRTIPLEVGEYYNLCFYTDKGLYQCRGVALNNHREDKSIMSVMRITSSLEKYQRRQYFRLECIQDIVYRIITEEEEQLEQKLIMNAFGDSEVLSELRTRLMELNRDWIRGSMTDLSGGGAKFTSDRQHNVGEKIQMKLKLTAFEEKKEIMVDAAIIYSGDIINRRDIFEHRVEFTNISRKDREELIRYIFEQERKRRKYDRN